MINYRPVLFVFSSPSPRGAPAASGGSGAGASRVHQTEAAAGGRVQPEESQV